ncbi:MULTISPECIES: NAD(P)-dependent oxidoreductase [unclassified Plantibacter]|uniref:NAD(P)-dependent oxidoreductase n=1 Tax=unclassified Plantibacter TaxID=2624265 RepID=UPI003D3521F4
MAHLLVLGGSGRTGRLVLEEALRRGHSVTALVRDAGRVVPGERLTVVEGSPLDPEAVDAASRGAQAVIVALSNGSAETSPPDLVTASVQTLTDTMRSRGIRRVVLLSALGSGDSIGSVPAPLRWATRIMHLGTVYRDHAHADADLRSSGLDWTIVRPTVLSPSTRRRPVVAVQAGHWPTSIRISRTDVADYLLDAVENDALIGAAPVISSGTAAD